MQHLNMHTPNLADENFVRLAALFPNAVTETTDADGKVIRAIDKDVLMQEINCYVVDGKEERYQFTWPDKKKSVLLANAPSTNTLRPCAEESVGRGGEAGGFDSENLYIEGDNLEVLKLLKETYLHKIKMIYIDPPYNTGNDFIYNDSFQIESEEFKIENGELRIENDGSVVRMVKNFDSNGRFHTDWLNMIYPRLRLAKDLLTDDGVIFMSIDDNEVENLKKVCNEVFGESNFFAQIIIQSNKRGQTYKQISKTHEYLLVYTKSEISEFNELEKIGDSNDLNLVDDISNFNIRELRNRNPKFGRFNRPGLFYPIYVNPSQIDKDGFHPVSLTKTETYSLEVLPLNSMSEESCWRWGKGKFTDNNNENTLISNVVAKSKQGGGYNIYEKYRKTTYKAKTIWEETDVITEKGTVELGEVNLASFFPFPKPLGLIKKTLILGTNSNDIILDFFSGSATTAHAVMQLNAEDGGNRKFIMVQLPEKCDESSEAFKAGYKNICEIGKERIRRAGKLIIENEKLKDKSSSQNDLFSDKEFSTINSQLSIPKDSQLSTLNSQLDFGFRVFKLDSSNMQEVYYTPQATDQQMLSGMVDNIKPDRTDMDLLFQVILEYGLPLSMGYVSEVINGCKVHFYGLSREQVDELKTKKLSIINSQFSIFLAACFDKAVNDAVVTEIAKAKPQYVALRDMDSDATLTNFEQIFNAISPETVCKVV